MSKGDRFLFYVLKILAWIIFVGLCIEAAALVTNFVVSLYNPAFLKNLYQKLDLSGIYYQSKWAFFGIYGFILSISLLKACMFYIVINLLTKLNLASPFNSFVSQQITQISYFTFVIGILSYIAREISKNLMNDGYAIDNLDQFWADSQAFILMAAVIYIIAAIFKKGVELQQENDLTV